MKHEDIFRTFLRDTVNLSQSKLDQLDDRVTAVYKALKGDETLGPWISGKTPQGSWAHKTIINPVNDTEFDADVLIHFKVNPDWASSPKSHIEEIYWALGRHPVYKEMPRSRKCRCVRLEYANSCHIDLVPYVKLDDGREVIVNRDDDEWETTDPTGFTSWMREKDQLANGNLRKVIRLMKYLRNHRGSFKGTPSVILTTLLGERVTSLGQILDQYSSLPDALVHIVEDLDSYLQARSLMPDVEDPSGTGLTFNHRWSQERYSYFRDRIHTHARQMREAYDRTDRSESIELWQEVFGLKFAPASESKSAPFRSGGGGTALLSIQGRAG